MIFTLISLAFVAKSYSQQTFNQLWLVDFSAFSTGFTTIE